MPGSAGPVLRNYPLDEPLSFLQALWAVVHALQKTSKRMQGTHGITGPQRLVLRVVGLHPAVTSKDLARILFLHQSTLTGILARLEEGGYLRRDVNPADRRSEFLSLTSRGRQAVRRTDGTVEAVVAEGLASFPPEHLETTRTVVLHLAGVLGGDPPTARRRGRPRP